MGPQICKWVDNGSFLIELRSTPQTDFESTVLTFILWTHLSLNVPATVSRIDMGISALGIVLKNWKPCEDRMHSFREICPKASSQNKCLHCNLRPKPDIRIYNNTRWYWWAPKHKDCSFVYMANKTSCYSTEMPLTPPDDRSTDNRYGQKLALLHPLKQESTNKCMDSRMDRQTLPTAPSPCYIDNGVMAMGWEPA